MFFINNVHIATVYVSMHAELSTVRKVGRY